jgi:hypothetical protein
MEGLERLAAIRKHSQSKGYNWKHRDLFRLMWKEDIWATACKNLSNGKKMSRLALDSFDRPKLKLLQREVLLEQRCSGVKTTRQLSRPKFQKPSTSKLLPDFSTKIEQETVAMILEAMFEPLFHNSFGFNINQGPHQALAYVESHFKKCDWVIKIDIKSTNKIIKYEVLQPFIQKQIEDQRFTNLIQRLLRSRFSLPNLTITPTQDEKLPSLLYNIYFHQISNEIENLRLNQLSRVASKQIQKFNVLKKHSSKDKEALKITKKLIVEETQLIHNKSVLNLEYLRYQNYWLIGFTGDISLCHKFKTDIQKHIIQTLKLSQSEVITTIINLRYGVVSFLGYDIYLVQRQYRTVRHKNLGFENQTLHFTLPIKKLTLILQLMGFVSTTKKGIRPISKANYVHLDDHLIIRQFKKIWSSFNNYYSGITLTKRLQYIYYLIRMSCAMTLAHKHKTTCRSIFVKKRKQLISENLKTKEFVMFNLRSSWFSKDRRWNSAKLTKDSLKVMKRLNFNAA